jgi:hypothetical protein
VTRRAARLADRHPFLLAGMIGLSLVLLAHPVATADVFSNVGPGETAGGLADRYPVGHYALDQHFTAVDASLTGGVDVSGVPPMIAYFLSNALWELTAFLANTLIALFAFAFSLDLLNGSKATGGAGALAPVAEAVHSIYAHAFGAPWLVLAVSLTSMWAMWRALIQRRYIETAGALAMSLVYLVIALAFVAQPAHTIGSASKLTNEMSAAFLSISNKGSLGSAEQAKRAGADQLFSLLVFEPWAVLEFGGTEHCVRNGTGSKDEDPESVPVRPLSAAAARQLANGVEVRDGRRTCINNVHKYASHFLPFVSGSDERDAEYDALNDGDAEKLPDADPAKTRGDYQIGIADKPATDSMEEGGQYQRLMVAVVVFVGELGAFVLIGALAVGVILSQVLLLLMLAFAPVALVFAVVPGRGHDFFRNWLTRLIGLLLRKAVYSLILAVVLAVNSAIASATVQLGWLMSWALQSLFFWVVFFQRHKLAGSITAATAGREDREPESIGRGLAYFYGARGGGRAIGRGGRAVGRGVGRTARGIRRAGRWVMPL